MNVKETIQKKLTYLAACMGRHGYTEEEKSLLEGLKDIRVIRSQVECREYALAILEDIRVGNSIVVRVLRAGECAISHL